MAPPIVLTTDFGLSDPYVGVMKGVILGINPQVGIIDLTHLIQPQNIRQAAFVLGASHRFFPQGTVHVVVVDPGVGTQRKAVLLDMPRVKFLAPDNGVLSHVLADYLDDPPERPGVVAVPPQCHGYQLTETQYWLHPVSNTFHGRDIFAPAAAHLSLGVQPEALGTPLSELVWVPAPQPVEENGQVLGEVIYSDHFGNLITNIPERLIGPGSSARVGIKGHRIAGLRTTFHDSSGNADVDLVALIGSHGFLEIAVPDGSAATLLNVGPGEPVKVSLPRQS
jgi:S-adenosylmethionine hydrolase